jgi:predicted Zn finger-like uncharacterized protein
MYTQCPECEVYFRITPSQLEARQGLVRCGQCSAIFQANGRLFDKLPEVPNHAPETTAAAPKRRRRKPASRKPAESEPLTPELVAPLLFPTRPRYTRLWLAAWSLVSLLLIALVGAQLAYLYRMELALHSTFRPLIESYCEWLECEIAPAHNVNRIEFETSIAPHPKFSNALRLRADLVNRAEHAQPYPLMEVTLTDSEGRPLSRRQFGPRDYLGTKADDTMIPNVVAHALLDVTNPDNRAVGYEIRLLPDE